MNALQHLWERLGSLLPPGTVDELRAQYRSDAQRDQRASLYRTYDRRHRAATAAGRDPERSARLAHWLLEHDDWRPL